MKLLVSLFLIFAFGTIAMGQTGVKKIHMIDSTKKVQQVETACGECQLAMTGKGCHLAVRIDGKNYFVDGTDIDDHGDAHAKEGFCNAIRKADVQGEIVDNRFKATYFKLVGVKKE